MDLEMDDVILAPQEPGKAFNIRYIRSRFTATQDKDQVFDDIYSCIYMGAKKHKVHQYIDQCTENPGLCTNKWLEETVAIKCYDCEADATCAICLECFFRSNHHGHRYRLTKTSGGCCDCGDNAAWNPEGACNRHNAPLTVTEERALLDMFHENFIARIKFVLGTIVIEITDYVEAMNQGFEDFVYVLLLFLDEFLKVTPAYRLVMTDLLGERPLRLWLRKHAALSYNFRKAFNSLYLTLLTSMSFKIFFADSFAHFYRYIMIPYNENTDDWQLSHLSVQLFTYSFIATKVVQSGFLEDCMHLFVENEFITMEGGALSFQRVDSNILESYLRTLADFTYIMNHKPVVEMVLERPKLQLAIFKMLRKMHMMNLIKRAVGEHVLYENAGYIISFACEHALHKALIPLAEAAKSNILRAAWLYRYMNEYILEKLCKWVCTSKQICRSFHVPFVRFFASLIDVDHIVGLYKNHLTAAELKDDVIVNSFDDAVLLWVLKQAVGVIRFSMEVKNKLWVYNGESMYNQVENYKMDELIHMDVAAIQLVIMILGLKRTAGLSRVNPLQVIYKEIFEKKPTLDLGCELDEPEFPLNLKFQTMFYMQLITIVLHDMRMLEMLSLSDRNSPRYVKRGYPLLKMDLVSALASGKLEFKEVTSSIDKHWKRHPHIVQALEEVATLSYSQIADKTYVRLKNDTYQMIDVLWEPHGSIADISIPQEVLKRDYSLLGLPRSAKVFHPEYYDLQDAILEGMGSLECLRIVFRFFKLLQRRDSGNPDDTTEYHPQALYSLCVDDEDCIYKLSEVARDEEEIPFRYPYFDLDICFSTSLDNMWNPSILGAIKTMHLLMETTNRIWEGNAGVFVEMLESFLTRIDDEPILMSAINYTTKRMTDTYHLVNHTAEEAKKEDRKEAVKSIQSKFMLKMMEKQKKTKIEGLDDGPVTFTEEDGQACILCREKMDDSNPMSVMCLISTNSVMRNCVQSLGGTSVYAKASLPLRSSIISSCGHIAHTKCIKDHLEKHADTSMMGYGSRRSRTEYFCPVCKALCNYTMQILPDSVVRNRNDDEPYSDYNLDMTSVANWRHEYSAIWMASPIHARATQDSQVTYNFGSELLGLQSRVQHSTSRSFMEDIGFRNENKSLFSCKYCIDPNGSMLGVHEPKCNSRFFRKKQQQATIDRDHLASELSILVTQRPNGVEKLKKIFNVDLVNFKRRLTEDYCMALFTGKQPVHGIQNWRHLHQGSTVEFRLWILYNELLAMCCCARSRLTVKHSMLRNIVRTCYAVGNPNCLPGFDSEDNIVDYNYFDITLMPRRLPIQTPKNDEESGLLNLLLECMTEAQLKKLVEALEIETKEAQPDHADESNMEDSSGIINHSITSPWSKDVVRDFMIWFIESRSDPKEALDGLAKGLGGLIMQLIERVALRDIKQSFAAFVEASAANGVEASKYRTLIHRRKFVKTLYEEYFREYIESAEFSADLLERVDWIGLKENEEAFRIYNGLEQAGLMKQGNRSVDEQDAMDILPAGNIINSGGWPRSILTQIMIPEEIGKGTIKEGVFYNGGISVELKHRVEDRIFLLERLQLEHQRTVDAFTKELPDVTDGDIKAQVKNYIYEMTMGLLKVRRLYELVEHGIEDSDLDSLIMMLRGTDDVEGPDDAAEAEDTKSLSFIFSDKFSASRKNDDTVDETSYYHGMDFVKRINVETHQAHCNYAFFEVIRHLVPTERHLMDFLGQELYDEVKTIEHQGDLISLVNILIEAIYNNLKKRGYLKKDFEPDMDYIMSLMLKHLNFALDAAFWLIYSVFDKDEDTCTKVSYAHLQPDEARFNLLVNAMEMNARCSTIKASCEKLLTYEEWSRVLLLRASGVETMAPLVSGYDFIDMRKHLEEDAWSMVKLTALRMCPNCGTQPADPLVCLICGCLVCHHSPCCNRNKNNRAAHLIDVLERENVAFRLSDVMSIYNDELETHTNTCGGGQGVYISPYNCYILVMDETRHCVTPTLYTDNYGNKDLHSKVYGPLTISQTRLASITNALCQGKLTHEIINIHREALA